MELLPTRPLIGQDRNRCVASPGEDRADHFGVRLLYSGENRRRRRRTRCRSFRPPPKRGQSLRDPLVSRYANKMPRTLHPSDLRS